MSLSQDLIRTEDNKVMELLSGLVTTLEDTFIEEALLYLSNVAGGSDFVRPQHT
jgi:hypothetical protein